MRWLISFVFTVMAGCSSIKSPVKPHTEVVSPLMWVVIDGEKATVTCRDEKSSNTFKITGESFKREPRGIFLSVLDVLVGAIGWFIDFGN